MNLGRNRQLSLSSNLHPSNSHLHTVYSLPLFSIEGKLNYLIRPDPMFRSFYLPPLDDFPRPKAELELLCLVEGGAALLQRPLVAHRALATSHRLLTVANLEEWRRLSNQEVNGSTTSTSTMSTVSSGGGGGGGIPKTQNLKKYSEFPKLKK